MLFHVARPTVGEEENTSATHVAQLQHDRKHTCNADTQQNTESTDQDYLKHQKLTFRQHNTNTNTPTHATLILHATRSTVCKEDNTCATVIRSIPATPKLVEIKIRSTRTASQHQNPCSVSKTQIPPLMLYHATRPTAGEEDNTSATP